MASPLSEEETNYLRMEFLLKSISPEAVRYHFDGLFPPANLLVDLNNKKAALKNLKRRRIINASQWTVLFPTGSPSVTSCNFDLTLMICLLRNISGLVAPVRGFDVLPAPSDTSPGADLARIKHYRNLSAHSGDGKLSNQMFNDAWKDVSEASIRLGGNVIQQKCANLEICSLDSSFFKQLLLDLKCQTETLTILTDQVETLMLKVETFEQTQHLILQDPVPCNIRETITKVISDWKSSDSKFVETNSSKQLSEVLKKNKIVVVTGNAGIGKSVTSRHVGLQMLLEGFDVLPVISPKDINKYAVKTRKSLFIFDDICGRYNIIQSEIEKWDRYASDIENCFSISSVKILATCRLQVFQHPILQRLELLTRCQFNMTSEKYATTVQEKRSIADVYIPEKYTKKMSEEHIQKYDCFPLLCCMVSKLQESNIIDFIGNPYNYFEGEFDKMLITAELNYCALLSVTVFNGKLSKTLLDDELSTKDKAAFVDIFEISMQNTNTPRTLLKNHLNILLGVYITKHDDIYSFIHGKIFDIACLYFSTKCMKCFIEHSDILLLCERFEFEFLTQTEDVQRIVVPESFEQKYFLRMLNEVTDLTFLDIFGCKQMKNEIFRKHFLHTLEKQNDELISKLLNCSQLGINILHLMCEQGDIGMVAFCIRKGMDINRCDDIGMSPLHIACKYGYEHVVNVLLQSGINVNSHKRQGLTPLYEACFTEKTQVVEKLLKSGARPNIYNKRGLIPLSVSAKNGNIKITQLLLQYKADVDEQNNDGISALHEACINEKEDIVDILIENGANIDIKTNNNETPLYFACKKHNCRIIDTLISKGACMFETSKLTKLSPLCLIKEKDDVHLLRSLLNSLKNKNTSLSFVYAELEKACFSNDSKFLRVILEMNINVDAHLSSGDTALTIACSEGFETIAEMLLNTKANVYGVCHNNRNPLQLACLNQHPEIVNMLISKNVDCNYISCISKLPFPLHISCMMNDYESIEALIQADADVNQISETQAPGLCDFKCKEDTDSFFVDKWNKGKTYMMTPLEIICMGKSLNFRIVKHLLGNKARTNIKSANGINPLLVACFYEYNDLIGILLKNEANINACDEIDTLCLAYMKYNGEEDIIDLLSYTDCATEVSKSTSLHIASMNNSHDMVNQLLQNNARLNISCNISPFLLAIQNGNYQMSGTRKMIIQSYKNIGVVKYVQPIHAACLSGYILVVKTLVQNYRFHYAETAISISSAQVACIKGYIYSDNHNMTRQYFVLSPLQISCLGQYWDIFKILMHAEMNFTQSFDVSTNLMACFSGDNKAIEASLEHTEIYKTSVLWLLIIHKQNDIAKYILDTIRNSDLEVSKTLKTLFLCACSNGNLEIASFLFSKLVNLKLIVIDNTDAFYSSCENCHRDVAEFLVSNCTCTESAIPDNDVPLQTAYRTCLDYIIQLLLRDGADPFLIKVKMNAFRTSSKSIQAECLRELFACWNENIDSVNNCPENFLSMVSDRDEKMLYCAYLKKNACLMKLIVSFGANINFTYGGIHDTLLMKVCRDNDIQLTKVLLENSPNLDIRNNEGETALCISCELDRFDNAELLVNYGANVNICNNEGLSPLYFACIQKKLNTVRLLLQNQADTNVSLPCSKSLLIICCESRAYNIVDLLLQYGADANFFYYFGDLALNKSCQMGDAKLIKSLLYYTSDSKVMWLDFKLQYYFTEACKNGCVDFVQMILQCDQSFDVNANLDGKTPLYACYEALSHVDSLQHMSQIKTASVLLRHGADLFVTTNERDTPFHQLCAKGNLSEIKEVLGNCSVNQTILEIEITRAFATKQKELVYLLNDFFSPQLVTDNLHKYFFLAAKYGMDDIVDEVLLSNIDLNSEIEVDQTALHIACSEGNDSIVEKLVACGKIDINKQSDNGYTALHFACSNGHRNVIEILLNNGAAINIRSYSDETIVAVASQLHAKVIDILLNWNMEEIIEQLFEHNSFVLKTFNTSRSTQGILRRHLISVDQNSYVDNSEFPLHIACRLSDNELVDELFDNTKVDVDCISKYGVTPLLICISNQDLRNTKKIIESGASVNKMTNISKEGVLQLFGHTTASFVKDLTPISFACFVQNCEIIQILIDQNANICSSIHISHGYPNDKSECEILTPLCISVILNNLAIVKLLVNNTLKTGFADVNYIMIGSLYENINMTEKDCLNVGRLRLTSFQVACVLGETIIASFLVTANKANVNNTFMITPIFLSLNFDCQYMLLRIMSTYKIDNTMFEIEVTPLIFSVLVENKNLIAFLLDNNANPEKCVSLSLLHVIALNKDILKVFENFEKDHDFKLECSINALFICCLKDNTDMTNALLQKHTRTSSILEITALHAVCFKGLVDHLRLIFQNDCHMSRLFFIQSVHLLNMYSNYASYDYIVERYINYNNTLNLRVTFTELSCLIKDSTLFAFLLKLKCYDDDVMEFTPLYLSLFVGKKRSIIRTEIPILSDLSSCSIISTTFIIILTWMTHGMLSNTSLLTFPDDLHEKQHINDTSLICLSSFHTNAYDDDLACELEFLSLMNNDFEVHLCQIIDIDFIFHDIEDEEVIKAFLSHSALLNKDLKINMTYLALLRDEQLQYLLMNSYSGISVDLLKFTHLEISYLVSKKLPQPLLNITKTTDEKATVSQLLVACLHENKSNIKILCSQGKTIQNNCMDVLDLIAFFYKTEMFDSDLPIIETINNKDVKVTFDELSIACLLDDDQIIKYLLQITNDVNARSYISPLHISIIRNKALVPLATEFLASIEDSRRGLDLEFISTNLCLPMDVNVVHLLCFLHDVELLRIVSCMKCDLNAIARVSSLFLHCVQMIHIHNVKNVLSAVSEMTPLHIACIKDDADYVDCILENSNHINVFCSIHPLHLDTAYSSGISELITEESNFTITALHTAILCKDTDIAKTLIRNDANIESTAKLFIEICIGTDTLICTHSTLKPLHLACLVENEDIFKAILAKTSIQNLNEKVKMSYCHLGYLNLSEIVISSGTIGYETEMRLNILHIACIIGKITYVELVLNANIATNFGVEIVPINSTFPAEFSVKKYPFHLSAEKGDLDICKLLLDHGANIEVKTNVLGLQPWHLALYHGYAAVMEFLLTNRRMTYIDKSRFMFIFMLYIMRKRFSRVILPFIAKSRKFLIHLSVYRYLRYVLSFPLHNKCDYTNGVEYYEYGEHDIHVYNEYGEHDIHVDNESDEDNIYEECD